LPEGLGQFYKPPKKQERKIGTDFDFEKRALPSMFFIITNCVINFSLYPILKWIFIPSIKIGYWLKQKTSEKAMRIKTMIIISITVLFTIVLMQNTEPVTFTILFGTFRISKLAALAGFSVVAFILGVMVGRPKKVKTLGGGFNDGDYDGTKSDTLSDEDRDYISHP